MQSTQYDVQERSNTYKVYHPSYQTLKSSNMDYALSISVYFNKNKREINFLFTELQLIKKKENNRTLLV